MRKHRNLRIQRRTRVAHLLMEGKTRAEVVSLTGESVGFVACVDREEIQHPFELILQALGGPSGTVEVTVVPDTDDPTRKNAFVVIAPGSCENVQLHRFLECLTKPNMGERERFPLLD